MTGSAPTEPSGRAEFWLPALPGLAVALLWIAAAVTAFPQFLEGQLGDPDSYTVIVRLRWFLDQGSLAHGFFPRDNAPDGMVLHWTMAFDLILLALAAPLAGFFGWAKALGLLAPAIGPICVLLLVIVASWAVAPILGRAGRAASGVLAATAPLVFNYGMLGNASHHLAIVVAWATFIGFAIRIAAGSTRPAHGVAAGFFAALALWLNVECIVGVAAGAALTMLAWVRDGLAHRRANLAFASTFAATATLAHLLDPPHGGLLAVEIDRLSIVYVAFALLLLLCWIAVGRAPQEPQAWRVRLLVAGAGAAAAALCLALLFPQLLAPQRDLFGSIVYQAYWKDVGELLPAHRVPRGAILWLASPALALLVAIVLAVTGGDPRRRQGWALYAALLALTVAPALLHVRFSIYPQIAALPALGLLVERAGLLARSLPGFGAALGQILATVALVVFPGFMAAALGPAETVATTESTAGCGIRPVAAALNDAGFMGGRDLILLTHPNKAPELLYWTGHRVVAGPYHRNTAGLTDAIRVMAGDDEAQSRAILGRRGVRYLLVCAAEATGGRGDAEAFFDRLRRGDAPTWLQPQPWPTGTVSDLRLFRVLP